MGWFNDHVMPPGGGPPHGVESAHADIIAGPPSGGFCQLTLAF